MFSGGRLREVVAHGGSTVSLFQLLIPDSGSLGIGLTGKPVSMLPNILTL